MNGLADYLDARRMVGALDTEAPPTEPMNPWPLDDDGEHEPTVVTHGGTPTEADDPCSICVAEGEP